MHDAEDAFRFGNFSRLARRIVIMRIRKGGVHGIAFHFRHHGHEPCERIRFRLRLQIRQDLLDRVQERSGRIETTHDTFHRATIVGRDLFFQQLLRGQIRTPVVAAFVDLVAIVIHAI